MSIHRFVLAIPALLLLIAAGCRGGQSIIDPPETPLIQVIHAFSRGVYRVYAPPDSVDPGSSVVVDGAGTHNEVLAAADGSLLLEVPDPSAASAVSQLPYFSVSYIKDGVAGQLDIASSQIIELTDRITKPLFSTGAGPNDMVFGNDSLYVANSFDNTVVRYGLDGQVLASAAFAEFASPSYLGLANDAIYVVANGTNTLTGLDRDTLQPLAPERAYEFVAPESDPPLDPVLFIGPSQPLIAEQYVCVPRVNITDFGPPLTTYLMGQLTCLDFSGTAPKVFRDLYQQGSNTQFGAFDPEARLLYVVATGQLSFDESWIPFVSSPSTININDVGDEFAFLQPFTIGEIAAGRIALHPDGATAALSNSLNGNLYTVDLEQRTVLRGEYNPIVLTEEFTYISDVSFTPDGRYVLATSFNTDELYVIDAYSDQVNPGPYPEPFDLSLDPELMAGVANVEVDPTPRADGGYDAYVLYGVANAVAKIELF